MSEYQYYEFQAVDRPLTERALTRLREFSSRAAVSPSRFVVTYNWGDFRGDPGKWMERWFDAHVHVASWGTRQLMLRLPLAQLAPDVARAHCLSDATVVTATDAHVVLGFVSEEDSEEDWDDGTKWMPALLPLRAEIAAGDHRMLYLAWLMAVEEEALEDDAPVLPPPPGLAKLSPAQRAFASFMRLDRDLVTAAAARSAALVPDDPGALRAWIAALPEEEKTLLLTRIAVGDGAEIGPGLLRRFRETRPAAVPAAEGPATVGDLRAAAEAERHRRERAEAERAARKQARADAEAAAGRARLLDALAAREGDAWVRVQALIDRTLPSAYDEAAVLLRDLRDLAIRDDRRAEWETRVAALRERYPTRPALRQRLADVDAAAAKAETRRR